MQNEKNEIQSMNASMIILADVSGSMKGDKIVRLRKALKEMWPELNAILIAFSYKTWICETPDNLPEPDGGTDMIAGFEHAAKFFPSETIVISDGRPNDESGTLNAASLLPGVISVLFVGNDEDTMGADFMQRLAHIGGGMYGHKDLAKHPSITGEIRTLLGLPSPIAL
jgi:Mg-chelatase subunit ChlD